MNRQDIIRMAEEAGFFIKENEIYSMSTQSDQELTEWIERFAALVASAEREAWEHRYARLQSLMDVRETQPNKPCCLAEREACAKVCEDAPEPDGADLAERIRARGNVATNDTSQKRVDKTSEIVHEAQRTWVGLTDDEIDQGLVRTKYAMQTAGAWRDGVEWAVKQLQERNT